MRGYWPQTSGLACDPRWARLSGCARGLLASLLDAADGPGEIDLHGMSALDVARAVLPHDDLATVTAALAALQGARFVAVDEDLDALCVSLPRPNVAPPARAPSAAPTAESRDADEREHSPQRARAALRAHFTNRKLKTSDERTAWLCSAEGAGVLARLGLTADEGAEMASRAGVHGGRFGSVSRQQAPAASPGSNGSKLATVTVASPVASALPSHTLPSERNSERERENEPDATPPDGSKPEGTTAASLPPSRQQAPAASPVDGDNNRSNAERIEEALTKRSSGRIDTLSAPASTRFALRELLREMGVDLALAERMGELAANPGDVWPYLRETSRVTLTFLVGKVDNNGVRAAGPLVELVSRARADLAARGPSASPEPAARPRPRTTAPMSDADAAESLRVAQEFAARRRNTSTSTQEPTHVP